MLVNIFRFLFCSFLVFDLKYTQRWGIVLRYESFWIGVHYSGYNKRFCLNIIPGLTIWWIKKDGKQPHNI